MRSIAAVAAVLGLAAANVGHAAGIEVRNAWIPATPPGARTAAGYGSIANHGPTTDRLMGGHTAAAASVEVHKMSTAGGVMRMRLVAGGLAIGASETADLGPRASYHLMLIGLKAPLTPGRRVRVVLHFQRAGDVAVDFPVRAEAPAGRPAGMHM